MSSIVNITKQESDEYVLVLEKLLALRSLKIILGSNEKIKKELSITNDLTYEIGSEIKQLYKNISDWWERIDEKYVLVYNEDKMFNVDFNRCYIYEVDKYEKNVNTLGEV